MRKVTVSVAELRSTVASNRDNHVAEFAGAKAGWEELVIEKLTKALADAKKGEFPKSYITLPTQPESHEDDYDRVLKMLEMTTDERVELDAENFAQYVMDDWDWKRDFTRMSDTYNKR